MNGDGYVLSSDGLLVLGQLGNSLPAAAPVATLFPAAMGNSAVSPSLRKRRSCGPWTWRRSR